jgi:hypothetical protein
MVDGVVPEVFEPVNILIRNANHYRSPLHPKAAVTAIPPSGGRAGFASAHTQLRHSAGDRGIQHQDREVVYRYDLLMKTASYRIIYILFE